MCFMLEPHPAELTTIRSTPAFSKTSTSACTKPVASDRRQDCPDRAPQHPWAGGMTTSHCSRASTRAVAVLTLGENAPWTPPPSMPPRARTPPACPPVPGPGRRPAPARAVPGVGRTAVVRCAPWSPGWGTGGPTVGCAVPVERPHLLGRRATGREADVDGCDGERERTP